MEEFLVQNKTKILETLGFSAFPVIGLISALCGLKTWLKYELYSNLLVALVLIFCPFTFYKHTLDQKLDYTHLYLLTLAGAIWIALSLYVLMLRDSKDESIFNGHLWARFIGSAMMFVVTYDAYKNGSNYNYKIMCFNGGAFLTVTLVNGYFYLTSTKQRNNMTFNDPINVYCKIESLKSIFYGLMFFGFPHLILASTATDSHRVVVRYIGGLLFTMGLQGHSVPDFMYLADKKTFILTRLIGGFITFQALLVGFYFYKAVTMARLAYVVGGYAVYSSVLAYGYCSAKVKNE